MEAPPVPATAVSAVVTATATHGPTPDQRRGPRRPPMATIGIFLFERFSSTKVLRWPVAGQKCQKKLLGAALNQ